MANLEAARPSAARSAHPPAANSLPESPAAVSPEAQSPAAQSPEAQSPDPVLTANLYCAGRLDDLLHRGVVDFWQRVRAQDPQRLCRLWFVRYRRGGEHLKLRVHAPAALAPFLREQLEQAAAGYFASLPAPDEAELAAPRGRTDVPPIDPEDRAGTEYPDRSLLFTTYERSFISLGGPPLMLDDEYVGHLTTFMADTSEQLLADLKPDATGQVPHQKRQTSLMKMLIGSLATLDWSEERRTGYLLHHRDWLLRFSLLKALDRREKARELTGRFRQQVDRMGAGVGPIERTFGRVWDGAHEEAVPGPLRRLADRLETFRDRPGYQLDPFTEEPSFTGVFKALHAVANQLGLPMVEEAFTHHLLLQVRAPQKADAEVAFLPF